MTFDSPELSTPAVNDVIAALFSQVMSVMGLTPRNWIARCFYPLLYPPMRRLCRWLVELDRNIAQFGWNPAVNQFMSHLVTRLELHGEDNIPLKGPVMVACNHPAALDVVILAAAIHRNNMKIIISDIPIVQMLPHLAAHCIPVYYDLPKRLHTIREAIRHLEQGGSLLIFPRGNVEPDPAVSPGAVESLSGWSPSLELFLRKVPQTVSVVAIASGMLSAGWYKLPLIHLWKNYEQRQKVAEVFQIAAQLVTGKTPAVTPTISFSMPIPISELGGLSAPAGTFLAGLTAQARHMLHGHHGI